MLPIDPGHGAGGRSVTVPAIAGPATMSSREVADLTGREHDNVRRDIKNMAAALSLTFEEKAEPSSGGRPSKVYHLSKRESLILVSGYSIELRARIIDRWEELERGAGGAAPDLSNPDVLRGLLASYADDKAVMQTQLAIAAPKLAALERLTEADGSLCITDAAKALQVQPKALFSFLRREGWIYRRTGSDHDVGYQAKVQAGYLEHKVKRLPRPSGPDKITEQVRVTPKGLARLAAMLETTGGL